MDLGKHYTALSVKDIAASKVFYENLGFQAVPDVGGVEHKWLILRNGDIQLGLYQDMFPNNTLTFNPPDARGIQKELKSKGIQPKMEADENTTGPCFLILQDPDGNAILIDQHS